MKNIPYYCTNCKNEVSSIDSLLFVEESGTKGFCCEKCILSFYKPLLKFFSDLEMQFKSELQVDEFEDYTDYYIDNDLLSEVTDKPDNQIEYTSEIDSSYHLHVKFFSELNIYFLIVCTHYDKKASFVYSKLITKNEKLVKKYEEFFSNSRADNTDYGDLESVRIPDEDLADLEQKKSEQLALLLDRRKDSDIPFETFNIYDDYLALTLEDPDSIFHFEDEAGDELVNYIKSFQKFRKDFYFVVTCQKLEIKDKDVTKLALLPVISFPSIDKDLYKFYAIGTSENTRLKN